MLRLSQKAWNNVVILAMLFMVFLFTLSNDMINTPDDAQDELMPLFPPYSVIMSLDFGFVRLERIGQDWRVKGDLQASVDELVRLSENWWSLEVQNTTISPTESPYVVSVLLAGEDKKRVFKLYPSDAGLLLQSAGRFYLASGQQIGALYPLDLLEKNTQGDSD